MLGTAKPTHRKSILWPTTRGRDVSKRILMEFTIASNEIQKIVTRNSKLAGPRRSACQWTLAQEDHSYCPSSEEYDRYKKTWYISLNKLGKNALMRLRSDFREALPNMHRLHRESGEGRPEPIPLHQYQRWHSSSSSSSSWWHWNQNWWSSYFLICCSRIVHSWWQSAATDGWCVNSTPHTSLFARVCAHV